MRFIGTFLANKNKKHKVIYKEQSVKILFEHAKDDFCWNAEDRVKNCPLIAGLFCFWKPASINTNNIKDVFDTELCRKVS